MTEKKPLIALAGAGFAVLAILGALLYPSAPGFVDNPEEIASFYVANDGEILLSNVLYLLGGALLLVFVGYLAARGRRAEGGDGRFAFAALAGGSAGAACALAGASIDAVAALRVQEQDRIDATLATVTWDLSSVLYGLAAPIAIAVFVLAVSWLSFSRDLLPIWLGAIGVLLGIALLVPPVNWLAMIAFTFWVLVTSVVLYLAGEPESEGSEAG